MLSEDIMRVRCIREEPTREQAERMRIFYRGGKQTFGVIKGTEYLVFGLRVVDGVTLVDIAQEFEQLVPVPLWLFEITDHRVPSLWEARQNEDGSLLVWPRSFFDREYYHEDLLEKVPSVIDDFRRVRRRLELEGTLAAE